MERADSSSPVRHVLPDLLQPGLRLVFCGTAVGDESARRRSYYAGPGNKFWRILAEVGLTDRLLKPAEYARLLDFGIGLTDLVKTTHGPDRGLSQSDFDVVGLVDRIAVVSPKVLAFNGITAARQFLGLAKKDVVVPGRRVEQLGRTLIYVLPSTAGTASGYWSAEPWSALAADLSSIQ
ncbi:MAG: mismatch-specific DNA-glycosylase [Cucumibacter sp.]